MHEIKSPQKDIAFESSKGDSLEKVEPQRDRYPLVVMLVLNDRECEDQVQGDDVVSDVESSVHLFQFQLF